MVDLIHLHPSQTELLAYAESSGTEVADEVVSHVERCAECMREVQTIESTIAIAAQAAAIEPTREFHATVLFTARQYRGPLLETERSTAFKAMACAAVLVVASAAGALALHGAAVAMDADPAPGQISQANVFSLELLRQMTPEEQLLGPVVLSSVTPSESPWIASQQRAAGIWDSEIDDALAALEQNPAYVRAASVVNSNRTRLGETLKVLYVEQSN